MSCSISIFMICIGGRIVVVYHANIYAVRLDCCTFLYQHNFSSPYQNDYKTNYHYL